MRLLIASLLVVLVAHAHAADPVLRIETRTPQIVVGEKAELVVTVLVPTWFTGPQAFPSFDIPNAVVRLPENSSYPMSDRINGENWSGIRRHYEFMPIIPGAFDLGSEAITENYAHPETRRPVRVDARLPALQIVAVTPKGAESLDPYISGDTFEVERDITGLKDELETGDVITLTYTARLGGLPAMFIPELAPIFGNGFKSYYDEPVSEEGDVATRQERVTLIVQASGDYRIPASRFRWWDLDDGEIREISLAAIEPVVAQPEAVQEAESASKLPWLIGLVMGVVIIMILVIRRGGNRADPDIEQVAFAELKTTLQRGDERESYTALLKWISIFAPGMSARQLFSGDQQLSQLVDALSLSVYAEGSEAVDLQALRQAVQGYREGQREQRLPLALQPLNP